LAACRRRGARCRGGCRLEPLSLRPAWLHRQGKGKTVAVIRHPAALEEDCHIADIVIAPFSVGKGCETAARVVIDRRALQAEGAHAIYIEGLSIRSESVAATRGRRPWVPERQIAKPSLPSGQAYARDQGASEEAPDPRFDGNPEE